MRCPPSSRQLNLWSPMFGIGGFLRLKIFEVVRKYPAYPIALCWTKCIQSHVIPIPIRSFRFAFGNNILECLYYKKTFALHSFHVEIAEDGTAPPGGKVRWQVMDIMQKLHIEFVATHRKVYFSCFLIRSVLWPKSPKTKACLMV